MSNPGSFYITLKNNKTEKEGINYLLSLNHGFVLPDISSRIEIMRVLNLEKKFARAFDLVLIKGIDTIELDKNIIETHANDLTLIELKTTKKFLPNNPQGFFFGATQNEFDIGHFLCDQFRFCFVCLNERSSSYKLLSIPELEQIIRNKRIQYQINL
ncbi:MAG: hypothetical protein ABIO55_01075 [Ginsengibacter sp.]